MRADDNQLSSENRDEWSPRRKTPLGLDLGGY